VEALIAQLVQVSISCERRASCAFVTGAIIYQKAGLVIDKERRNVRYRRCDNAWAELFNSGMHAFRHSAERHQQAAGVLIGASDQFAVIGVTQLPCVLRELINDFGRNIIAAAAGASVVNELRFPEHDPPAIIAGRFKRNEVHSRRYPPLRIERVGR
jgi:hypothetical protein